MSNVRQLPATAQPPIVPMTEMVRMAEAIAKSGLFGVKTPDQAMALMLVAQAEGRHPAIAARDYDIIQGRPAKKSEAMLRDFIQSGGSVKWHALDDTKAEATFSHPQGGEVMISWDMRRAHQAGLTGKDMYKKFPRQMLRSRCISEGVRTVCPMATSGMYAPEEVIDITPAPQGNVIEQPSFVSDERRQELIERAEAAATITDLEAFWKEAVAECEAAKDKAAYDAIKEAVKARKKELDDGAR